MSLREIFIAIGLTFIISMGFGLGAKLFAYLLQKTHKHRDRINSLNRKFLVFIGAFVICAIFVSLCCYLGFLLVRYEEVVSNPFLKWVISNFFPIFMTLGLALWVATSILNASSKDDNMKK